MCIEQTSKSSIDELALTSGLSLSTWVRGRGTACCSRVDFLKKLIRLFNNKLMFVGAVGY